MDALAKRALEALVAATASAQVDSGWRCAVCGCTAVEAGRRAERRGRALPGNSVTCCIVACQRERERQRVREKHGPGTAYYLTRRKAVRRASGNARSLSK